MHQEPINSEHYTDSDGNPTGGVTTGTGFRIDWQHGPIGENARNGAMIEEVIEAVLDRLRFLNETNNRKFSCRENSLAITDLESAQNWLYRRTRAREARGVEGTNKP